MAMNVQLSDGDAALLRELADAEQVSVHEAAARAICRSAGLRHTARVREATAEMPPASIRSAMATSGWRCSPRSCSCAWPGTIWTSPMIRPSS